MRITAKTGIQILYASKQATLYKSVRRFLTLLVFLFLFWQSSTAQILFSQGFEGSFPPPGWTIINAGIGNTWVQMPSASYAQTGSSCMQYPSSQNFPANTWAFSPLTNFTQGATYRVSYWYRQAVTGYTEKMKVTIGNAASVAAQTTVLHDYPSITSTTYIQSIDTFTVPSSGSYTIAFHCYSPANLSSRLLVDNVVLEQLSCGGTPSVGVASGPSGTLCSGNAFGLFLAGGYSTPGISLQWQSSAAGANNFTNIAGANTQSISTSQTSSKDYRCLVSCSASGLSAVSNTVSVFTPALCYCKPITNCNANMITNVKMGTLNNATSTCSLLGYVDYAGTVAAPTIDAGIKMPISVSVGTGGITHVGVWIDYDHSSTFDANEFKAIGSGNGSSISDSIVIPANIIAGGTKMRVRSRFGTALTAADACLNYSSGETEDYDVIIGPAKVAIYFTPFSDTLYDPSFTLTAIIKQKDTGLNNTDSLKPRVWVKKYGSSTWKSFKGNLANGTTKDGQWQFVVSHDSLGIRRNGCDSIEFYFVAQDLNTPIGIGYAPETGTAHSNVLTQITPPLKPFGYRLVPRMKDTVYVSAADCRFQSLSGQNGLFAHVNQKTLEGDLTIVVESDLVETGVHPLTSVGVNGKKVTIRPDKATLRTISAQGVAVVSLRLDSVKNFLIDGSFNGSGKFLKFRNQTVSYDDTASDVKIYHSCENITIVNSIFEHNKYGWHTSDASIWVGAGINKNILVRDNLFQSISASEMPNNFVISTDGINTATVIKNDFTNFRQYGVIVLSPSKNWLIDSNQFYRTLVPDDYSYDFSAVVVSGGGHRVSNNYIGGKAPFTGGGAMSFVNNPVGTIAGIVAKAPAGTDAVHISDNRIDNIDMTYTVASQTSSFSGILAIESHVIIRNNVIGNPTASVPTISGAVDYMYGINAHGSQPVEILNNSVSGLAPKRGPGPLGSTSLYGISKVNVANGFPVSTVPAVVSGNRVFRLSNTMNNFTTEGTVGIVIMGGSSNLVEKNIVHDISVTEHHVTGLSFRNGAGNQPTTIQRNRIFNLVNTSIARSSCCNDDYVNGMINGIAIDFDNTQVDLLHNQISLTNNNIANPVVIRGIFQANNINNTNPRQRVIYNTVYIGGTATENGGSAPYFTNQLPVKQIYNNIFYNERTGGTKGHFAYRCTGSLPDQVFGLTRANHNLYVVHDSAVFAQWSFYVPVVNWSTWKNNIKSDDTSYLARPTDVPSGKLFMDKANGNLNINFANVESWYANEKALPFAGITADYDSTNVRSTMSAATADIGSDEFSTATVPPGGVCAGGNISFASSITGTSYQWQVNTGSGFTNLSNNANYNGTGSATLQIINAAAAWNGYQYRCLVGSTLSNVFTLTILSPVTPAVSITASANSFCAGVPATFLATPTNGGSSPQYQWQVNGVTAGVNSNSFITSTLHTNDQVKVIMTSNLPCALPATSNVIPVTVLALPQANAGSDRLVCTGGNGVVIGTTAVSGNSYLWTPSTGLSAATIAQPTASPSVVTTYVLTVSSANGCAATDTVVIATIPTPPAPTITISGNVLTSSAISGNQWYRDGVSIPGATARTHTASANGIYKAEVTLLGCTGAFSNAINFVSTGISNPLLDGKIITAPNPVTDKLLVRYQGNATTFTLQLKDLSGRNVTGAIIFATSYELDMSGVAAGMYVVQVVNHRTGEKILRTIVKQ